MGDHNIIVAGIVAAVVVLVLLLFGKNIKDLKVEGWGIKTRLRLRKRDPLPEHSAGKIAPVSQGQKGGKVGEGSISNEIEDEGREQARSDRAARFQSAGDLDYELGQYRCSGELYQSALSIY